VVSISAIAPARVTANGPAAPRTLQEIRKYPEARTPHGLPIHFEAVVIAEKCE
jgi:hypothetical protein